jgi:hypothetical protein
VMGLCGRETVGVGAVMAPLVPFPTVFSAMESCIH